MNIIKFESDLVSSNLSIKGKRNIKEKTAGCLLKVT